MEVRDDIISVVKGVIDADIGEYDACDASDRKQNDETNGPQHRHAEAERAARIVAIHEKTLMPVGTAIIMEAKAKYACALNDMPTVYM